MIVRSLDVVLSVHSHKVLCIVSLSSMILVMLDGSNIASRKGGCHTDFSAT